MFLGHFAVGLASKKLAPRTNAALLIAAPVFADLLWPFFLLLGWEQVRIDPGNTRFTPLDFIAYPWSHSLLMLAVWATLFAGIYYGLTRYRIGAIVIWIGVVSHWVLDWITHRPDMPLYPGGAHYGLGLWNSIAGTMVVELAIFAIGVWIYIRATQPKDRIGRYVFLSFVLVLLAIYLANAFSPPPPSVKAIIWSAILAEGIFLPWAWWFDHHRTIKEHKLAATV